MEDHEGHPFTPTGQLTITVGLKSDGTETQVWSTQDLSPDRALGLLEIVKMRLLNAVLMGG